MVRGKGWLALVLCGAVSLTAIACRGNNESAVEVPPTGEEQLNGQPVVIDPAPSPDPAAAPSQPESGGGGTGTALNPPQAAQLIAAEPGSQINLRSQPTTTATAKGYGVVGDPVQLMRTAEGSDGTWYFVKFEQSGAEGWIRGDFINTTGQATPLSPQASASSTCEGLMEAMTFIAFYDANGFNQVRFTNLETRNTFDGSLSRQGSSNQGQPLYRGTMSPPTGGSYAVELTDLSGGTPSSGSQVAVSYEGIEGTGTCK